jgi:hypothetical protein
MGSAMRSTAFAKILSSLIATSPALPFVHVPIHFLHSCESSNDFKRWCCQHDEQLRAAKYIVLHCGGDHFCSLIVDRELWRAGPPPSSADASRQQRAARRRRSAVSAPSIGVALMLFDTFPSACPLWEADGRVWQLISRALNEFFQTEWPESSDAIQEYVYNAGPPMQDDLWSCGYRLLYAWSLCSKQPLINDLSPQLANNLCSCMSHKVRCPNKEHPQTRNTP